MNNIIEFTGRDLTADRLSANAARVSIEEGLSGSFVCYERNGHVVCVPPDDSLTAGRVLRRAAFELGAVPCAPNAFFDDADHDTAFAENLPSPDEEIPSLFFKFRLSDTPVDKNSRIIQFCTQNKLDYSAEADGFSIFLNSISVLNLYYEPETEGFGGDVIGELDATLLGAGIYVQAMEVSEKLCDFVGGHMYYPPDNFITYPLDYDFESLRQLFYTYMRQQLAFAESEDLAGNQAYIGWSVDTFEPVEIPGSVITPYGRWNLEKLKEEIRVYGFEAVVDHRLLFRNTPSKNAASDEIGLAHFFLWNDVSNDRAAARRLLGMKNNNEANVLYMMGEALRHDPGVPVLKRAYKDMLTALGKTTSGKDGSLDNHPECFPHYSPVGYLNGVVKYGFGSYLRNFKLPGGMLVSDPIRGRYVHLDSFEIEGTGKNRRVWCGRITVTIDYGPDAQINEDFIRPEYVWSDIDIGGSDSVCRLGYRKDLEASGLYSFLAVIRIRDEVYYFESVSDKQSLAQIFIDAVTGCRAVEDVDDLIPNDHTDKPRAYGATFFVSGEASRPPFSEAFKQVAPLLIRFREPIITLTPKLTQTTDISTKLGGVPYCPPGTSFPIYKGKRFTFICQLNLAELNREKKFDSLPDKGLIQLWTRDLGALFDKPVTYLRARHPDLRVRWYPDPQGGYVTEQKGAALIPKHETMLPTIADETYEKIMEQRDQLLEGVIRDYPDEFESLFVCRKTHIGGSPELIGVLPHMFGPDAEASLMNDEVLLQLEIPKKNGRMLFMIPTWALNEGDFTCVNLIAYRECHENDVRTISQALHATCEGETLSEHSAQRLKNDKSVKSLFDAIWTEESPDEPPCTEEDNFDLNDYDLGGDYGTDRVQPSRTGSFLEEAQESEDLLEFLRGLSDQLMNDGSDDVPPSPGDGDPNGNNKQ